MVYSEYNVNKMLFTYQKSCEKLAKRIYENRISEKSTHPVLKREGSLSLLGDDRLDSSPAFHRDLACQSHNFFPHSVIGHGKRRGIFSDSHQALLGMRIKRHCRFKTRNYF